MATKLLRRRGKDTQQMIAGLEDAAGFDAPSVIRGWPVFNPARSIHSEGAHKGGCRGRPPSSISRGESRERKMPWFLGNEQQGRNPEAPPMDGSIGNSGNVRHLYT